VVRTQTQLDKQVEHSVDREEYLRRDREIQRARAYGDQRRAAGRERYAALYPGVDRVAPPLIRSETTDTERRSN
jgi:hypothetical protein